MKNPGNIGCQIIRPYQAETAGLSLLCPAHEREFVAVPDLRFFPDLLGNHDLSAAVDGKDRLDPACRTFPEGIIRSEGPGHVTAPRVPCTAAAGARAR